MNLVPTTGLEFAKNLTAGVGPSISQDYALSVLQQHVQFLWLGQQINGIFFVLDCISFLLLINILCQEIRGIFRSSAVY